MGVAYLLLVFIFGGCGKNTETVIKFADVGWDSIKFHNAVAMFVAKEAYGFKTDEISATMHLPHKH